MAEVVAKLICDGSLDSNDRSYDSQRGTLLGGYAGGISIETDASDYMDFYTASVPSLPTSTLVELRAIEHGLHRMKRMMSQHDLNIDKLIVYTDSQDAVKNYRRLQADSNAPSAYYRGPVTRLISRIRDMGIADVEFEYVKAHVDNAIATPIERMHNVVDRAALKARWAGQEHAFDPEGVVESPYYGIILDTKVSPSDAIMMKELAYNMAMKGMTARVALEGERLKGGLVQHHPFMQGLAQAAAEKDVHPRTLWFNCGSIGKDEMANGISGYDETYLNQYYFNQGRTVPKDIRKSRAGFNAAIAARVYMGQGIRQIFNERSLTGRFQPPSQVVFNFGSQRNQENGIPFSVSGWAEAYRSEINIHQEQSLSQAMTYANRTADVPFGHDFESFFCSLDEVSDGMEPEQIANHLIGRLTDDGFTLSARLRTLINESAYDWVSGGDKALFHEVMRTKVVDMASDIPYYPHPSQMPPRNETPAPSEPEVPRETLSLSR